MRAVQVGPVRYFPGSGCVVFEDGAVVDLTVREEELFDLLRQPPYVAVPFSVLCESMAMSADSIKQLASGIRLKLGPTSIMASRGRGYRLNPAGIVRVEWRPRLLDVTAARRRGSG